MAGSYEVLRRAVSCIKVFEKSSQTFFRVVLEKRGKNDMRTDTIAAIATAMSSSGIGIVRISGDEAVAITDQIFEMKNQKKLEDMPTHTIHYGHIHDGDEVIDEVMVLLMRGPKSYTRKIRLR